MHFQRRLVIALALIAPLVLIGAGGKSKAYLVSMHVEAAEEEAPKFASPVKLGSESRQYFFKKIPDFNDEDIAYFYPFVAQDGQTFGAAFRLKPHPSEALKALCLTHQGKLLGIRIPNAPYTAVLIDKPVHDGIVVCWRGLSKEHLRAFSKKFPHVEQVPGGASPPDGAPPDPAAVALPPGQR